MNKIEILEKLPYGEPFLFVDELLDIHSEGAVGKFTFKRDMNFYRGHFEEVPITPGVILTEMLRTDRTCVSWNLSFG